MLFLRRKKHNTHKKNHFLIKHIIVIMPFFRLLDIDAGKGGWSRRLDSIIKWYEKSRICEPRYITRSWFMIYHRMYMYKIWYRLYEILNRYDLVRKESYSTYISRDIVKYIFNYNIYILLRCNTLYVLWIIYV